ncbi:hypothetical protein ARTHRO9AX_180743 [Arthrobacter sp. 9AX]|nr:hypothetical protein ARTHRO9AX_180743 [Arthrobacter sp. 9AX]
MLPVALSGSGLGEALPIGGYRTNQLPNSPTFMLLNYLIPTQGGQLSVSTPKNLFEYTATRVGTCPES